MKKLLFLVFLLAAGVGAAVLAQRGLLPGVATQKVQIKKKTWRFLECLKFKEFQEAAAFHTAEDLKANPNIPKQLESFFKIPHENLDIQDIEIDFIECDSTGMRCKVKTTTTVHVLNRTETKRIESMLYWKKVDGQWYLDLRTTLERGATGPF
ncbi:MAG TPA: hypothetical protein DD417_11780 [Elusimicrobia bacterium]|nr:hypothetical protein [Elusimicrobiota bacterium]